MHHRNQFLKKECKKISGSHTTENQYRDESILLETNKLDTGF